MAAEKLQREGTIPVGRSGSPGSRSGDTPASAHASSNLGPPPDQASRSLCYAARDKYYDCKARNGDREEPCAELRREFEGKCIESWVSVTSYFFLFLFVFIIFLYFFI